MKYIVTIGFFLMIAVGSVYGGQFYKWVDKHGEMHYTQTPPPPDLVGSNEKIKNTISEAVIPVSRRGDYDYCGKTRLPGPVYEPKRILSGLESSILNWEEDLVFAEKNLRRIVKSQSQSMQYRSKTRRFDEENRAGSSRRHAVNRVQELKCAIAWARKTQKKHDSVKSDLSFNVDDANQAYQTVLSAAKTDCGENPSYQSKEQDYKYKKNWELCMTQYRDALNKHKRELDIARRSRNRLE